MLNNLKIFVFLILISAGGFFSISAQTIEKTAPVNIHLNEKNQHIFSKNVELSADESDFDSGRQNYYFHKSAVQNNETENAVHDTAEPTNYKLRRGEKELNVEAGYSPFQPTFLSGVKEYDTSGHNFGLINLRWGRVAGTVKGVTYEYQAEITPLAVAFKNEVENPAFQNAQITPNVPPTIRKTTYGMGFSPVGFRFIFLPKRRLKPFAAAHAGFIFFRQPVPQPHSLTYDFAGNFGGGLQYQIKRDKAVSFGYKYFHISNMNIGEINPGYNANVFYIEYSFFYK